jgi:competence protein ComEA
MNRPPEVETRWFSLSCRELALLALAVGVVLLAAAVAEGMRLVWRRGRVEVSAHTEVMLAPARLNVNTASDYELAMLPGIGPVTAGAIIQWRTAHGPFKSLEQMEEVRGIGPKTIEAIRPHAMCAPVPETPKSAPESVTVN